MKDEYDFTNAVPFSRWKKVYFKIVKLYDGDQNQAVEWLNRSNNALNGRTPLDALRDGDESVVSDLVGRLDNGIFS